VSEAREKLGIACADADLDRNTLSGCAGVRRHGDVLLGVVTVVRGAAGRPERSKSAISLTHTE
jgi:hypothetical protein